MAFEQREGNGALFTNDQKGNEKAPQYKGDILLGGVVYELAGWKKVSAKGTFLSLSGKVKGERPAAAHKPVEIAPKNTSAYDDFESDIPF